MINANPQPHRITINIEAKRITTKDETMGKLITLLADENDEVVLNALKIISNCAEDYRGRFAFQKCLNTVSKKSWVFNMYECAEEGWGRLKSSSSLEAKILRKQLEKPSLLSHGDLRAYTMYVYNKKKTLKTHWHKHLLFLCLTCLNAS
jgi:hypothetical protein